MHSLQLSILSTMINFMFMYQVLVYIRKQTNVQSAARLSFIFSKMGSQNETLVAIPTIHCTVTTKRLLDRRMLSTASMEIHAVYFL